MGDHTNSTLPGMLEAMRRAVDEANSKYAKALGIPRSAAMTCVKPSGTVSQLVDSASGIHTRHSPYYIRRVRADKKDPLAQWMVAEGFPHEDDVVNDQNYVFEFPIKAPKGARTDIGSIEHLELWKTYQDNWCDHKPSVTVNYTPEEFPEIGAWLYRNFDQVSGVSFLPKSDHVYAQAPYEEITEAAYNALVELMPSADWSEFVEETDGTKGSQELACSGSGVCEIVDI